MSDHFFVEAIETAAIADLCADGHDAEAVELRAKLDAEPYDLVFLERAWSSDERGIDATVVDTKREVVRYVDLHGDGELAPLPKRNTIGG